MNHTLENRALSLVSADNYKSFIKKEDLSTQTCHGCESKLNAETYMNESFALGRCRFDISGTMDGFEIVSAKFKEFCEVERFPDLDFFTLPRSPGFFKLRVNRVLPYDPAEADFTEYCEVCKSFSAVTLKNVTKVLLGYKNLEAGIFRTDLCFAGGLEKSPLLIVNSEVKAAFKKAGLKGAEFYKN